MSFKQKLSWVTLGLAGLLCTLTAMATNVSTRPLKADVLVKPNIVFGMDDSGSMDFETMLYASDGAFWWDYNARTGWGIDANHPDSDLRNTVALWFNTVGNSSTQWRKMAYLFPNGSALGERFLTDSTNDHFAIMPTAQFAFLRSAAYNGLYYNTMVNYAPWAPATLGSNTSETVFYDATATATKSHPVNGSSTFNLSTAVPLNTTANYVFTALPGMTIPAGAKISVCNANNGGTGCGSTWVTLTVDTAAATNGVTRVAMSYYAPTFWLKEACTAPDVCATAPDGASLKRYEIKSTINSYPSGRDYAAEMQNFANWFQYYRKRKLMLAGAMGQVLEGLSGTRLGVVAFNSQSAVTMYDADDSNVARSRSRVAGIFYEVNRSGGTPTRETLKYIGDQYGRTNTDNFGNKIIQYACQRNNAFIVTDGFANASNVSGPNYDSGKSASTWGSGAPYQTIYNPSLADLALRYYTNNPRTDLTTNALTVTARDLNTNLHMNTYGLSMGSRGTIFKGDNTPVPTDVNAWPNPDQYRSPTSVDDLWHATINGRGKMYLATTPEETAQKVQAGLNDILDQTGTQSALSVSTINLRNTNNPMVYQGSYNPQGWAGDLKAYPINPGTGMVTTATPTWSAASLLSSRATARVIVGAANSSGSSVLDFTAANFGNRVNPGGAYGSNTAVVDYLRGNRTGEGTTFRARSSLMGAIISSRPVVDSINKVIYVSSGDGMLHAFDMDTGAELWAYIPYVASADMGSISVRGWNFVSRLDGSPMLATVGGKTMLISGLGTAGAGYFSIDVSSPRTMTAASSFTGKVWEFKGTGMGLSIGKPVVTDTTAWGTVALLTSGYNGTNDGVGRVYVLNAVTGALQATIGTTSYGSGDPGLARLSAFLDSDGKTSYAYAGDESGRLWRFNINLGTSTLITQFKNASGTAQPVTSAPELALVNGQRIIMVGTGRLLDLTDFSNGSQQSFYAIKDNGVTLANARTGLVARVLGAENGNREAGVTGNAFDWATDRGWYLDLPVGQQANTDPLVAFGSVAFTTNVASSSDCTSSSYLYLLDISSGKAPAGTNYGSVWLNNALAADVVILRTDGTVDGVNLVANISTSDSQILNKILGLNAGVTPRKNAWRQLLRPEPTAP